MYMIFLLFQTSTLTLGPTQPRIDGYRGSFPAAKRPRREVTHSPLSSAEDKNGWSCTATVRMCLREKDREKLTLLIYFVLSYTHNSVR
jgi:hypothetical protein